MKVWGLQSESRLRYHEQVGKAVQGDIKVVLTITRLLCGSFDWSY